LINVKKKYYILYIYALNGNRKLCSIETSAVKYEHLLTNYPEIVQYGFIRLILCLLLKFKVFFRDFFIFSGTKS
jgi:hypothetical protein